MKLSQLAAKPQLIKLEITDEAIVAEYGVGEPIEFWTWDRQPMDAFLKLATNANKDMSVLSEMIKTMVLDEDGSQVIQDGLTFPRDVLLAVMNKIVETVGK